MKAEQKKANDTLERVLWRKLYRFIRHFRTCQQSDAEDLTQEVFCHLIIKGEFSKMRDNAESPEHLLAMLCKTARNLMVDHYRKEQSMKRRGWGMRITLDPNEGPHNAAIDWSDPSRQCIHQELETALEECQNVLRNECGRKGQAELYLNLRAYLNPDQPRCEDYAEIAESAGTTVGAMRCALFRMRQRYRCILADHLADAA